MQFMYFTSEIQALKINFQGEKDALLEKVVKQMISWNKQQNNQIKLRKVFSVLLLDFFPLICIHADGLEENGNIIPIKNWDPNMKKN